MAALYLYSFANLLQHCANILQVLRFRTSRITYLLLVPRTLICTWTLFWDSPIYFGSAEQKRKYVDNPENRPVKGKRKFHHVRKTYKTILQISTQLVASRQEWFSFSPWMLGLRKNPSDLSASKNLRKLPLKNIPVTVVLF
jgi:hypothetical protein